jgi:hypothetical protein
MTWHTRRINERLTRHESGEYVIDEYVKGFGIAACEYFRGDMRLGECVGRGALERAKAACEGRGHTPELQFANAMEDVR